MAGQERVQPQAPREDADVEPIAGSSTTSGSDLDSDVDAILDEIDSVLEVNAEDFVKSFVQKGGQ